MMTTEFTTEGIGQRISDRWRGWLVFTALPTGLQHAEDSRRDADLSVAQRCWERPATDAERFLLAHLGFTVPDDLVCHVDRITSSVVCRRFFALESIAVLPEGISR
jgi:hypothetical protein